MLAAEIARVPAPIALDASENRDGAFSDPDVDAAAMAELKSSDVGAISPSDPVDAAAADMVKNARPGTTIAIDPLAAALPERDRNEAADIDKDPTPTALAAARGTDVGAVSPRAPLATAAPARVSRAGACTSSRPTAIAALERFRVEGA